MKSSTCSTLYMLRHYLLKCKRSKMTQIASLSSERSCHDLNILPLPARHYALFTYIATAAGSFKVTVVLPNLSLQAIAPYSGWLYSLRGYRTYSYNDDWLWISGGVSNVTCDSHANIGWSLIEETSFEFCFTARSSYARVVFRNAVLSASPSHACSVTKWKNILPIFLMPQERAVTLVLWHQYWLRATSPST